MPVEHINTDNAHLSNGVASVNDWKRIGVFTAGFESPFYGQIAEGIFNYLTPRKYQTLQYSNEGAHVNKQLEHAILSDLRCEGLIIHAQSFSDAQLEQLMIRYEKVILVNRYLESFAGQCVYTDDVAGGKLAARCLLDHGHEHIGVITGPLRFAESHKRTEGFKAELATCNLNIEVLATGDFHELSGLEAMNKILDQRTKITAVFVQNDEMAFGALTACRQRGIRVPEDLSVIGYDGLAICDFVTPKLTTIQQPLRLLGEQAAGLLCDMLENSTPAPTTANVQKPILAERESVAPPTDYHSERIVLTDRETECLTWTARGKTSWEISVILGISESTATFHLRNTVTKLKASNRTHAVVQALRADLISL